MEYSELHRIHQDHQVKLLALYRTPQESHYVPDSIVQTLPISPVQPNCILFLFLAKQRKSTLNILQQLSKTELTTTLKKKKSPFLKYTTTSDINDQLYLSQKMA